MIYRGGTGYLRVAAIAYLCAGAACGSSQAASDAGDAGLDAGDGPGGAGSCSANVPPGQACNTLASVGAAVTPTCMSGSIPAGTGGTIVDGTYTLISQTYYGSTTCSSTPINATLEIAGACIQEVTNTPILATASTLHTVAGATITRTVTCIDLVGVDAGTFTVDFATNTFTATPTTFTIFIKNSGTSSPNPDRVETYQKR
jgi:hypothetical protein